MSRPAPSLKPGILSTSFRAQTSLPAKKSDTGGIDAGRTIITPFEARKLQSAESLKPLSERDIGPGSFVALTQRAAARNVKAGLVDAFTRNRSVVEQKSSETEAEAGTETEAMNKTKPASTGEAAKPEAPLTASDAKSPPAATATATGTATATATPSTKSSPVAKPTPPPTSNSPLSSSSAKKTIDSTNASPPPLKPFHQLTHHDSPPNTNTNTNTHTRVSSAGSIGGKRVVSNTSASANGKASSAVSGEGPLQESNGNRRVVSNGASGGGTGIGKTGGQDGEVGGKGKGDEKGDGTGSGKTDAKEKRKSDGKFDGKGDLKKG